MKTTRAAHLRLIDLFYSVFLPALTYRLEPSKPSGRVSICIPWGDWQIKTNQFSVTLLLACNKKMIFHLCYRGEEPITLIKYFPLPTIMTHPVWMGFGIQREKKIKKHNRVNGGQKKINEWILSVPCLIPVPRTQMGNVEPSTQMQSQCNRK